jgi:hypothetical protein
VVRLVLGDGGWVGGVSSGSGCVIAEKEEGTTSWYTVKIWPTKFGIFETFADEKGREDI